MRMSTVTPSSRRSVTPTAPDRADIAEVLRRIGDVLDRSIEPSQSVREGVPAIDLSRLDFEVLSAKFAASPTKNIDLERMKAAIRAQARPPRRGERYARRPPRAVRGADRGVQRREHPDRAALPRAARAEPEPHRGRGAPRPRAAQRRGAGRLRPAHAARAGADDGERDEVKKVARQLLVKLAAIFTSTGRRPRARGPGSAKRSTRRSTRVCRALTRPRYSRRRPARCSSTSSSATATRRKREARQSERSD